MRVDERTENSMARHHLQSGVSGVKRGRLRGEVEAHAKALARRSDGRYSESDGDRGVLRRRTWSIRRARRKWCAAATPARPPPGGPHPATPLPDPKLQASTKPQTSSSSCWGASGVTSGPVSFMNTLISLRMPNQIGRAHV